MQMREISRPPVNEHACSHLCISCFHQSCIDDELSLKQISRCRSHWYTLCLGQHRPLRWLPKVGGNCSTSWLDCFCRTGSCWMPYMSPCKQQLWPASEMSSLGFYIISCMWSPASIASMALINLPPKNEYTMSIQSLVVEWGLMHVSHWSCDKTVLAT